MYNRSRKLCVTRIKESKLHLRCLSFLTVIVASSELHISIKLPNLWSTEKTFIKHVIKKMQICDTTFEMQFYLTVHGTYLTSIITDHMAWKPLLSKVRTQHCKTVKKSKVTLKHLTPYNYKDHKLHRRDKATMFLQHERYQDLLTGYVRVIRKHGGGKSESSHNFSYH